MCFYSWICKHAIYCGVAMATGYSINRFQLSIKDTHWVFNGGHCSVGLVSQRSGGGGGIVRLCLAEQQGDVIHQKQVRATVKCWTDIQSLPLLWGWEGAKETAATFFCRIDIGRKLILALRFFKFYVALISWWRIINDTYSLKHK